MPIVQGNLHWPKPSITQGGVDFNGSNGQASFTAETGVDSGSGPVTVSCMINADTVTSNGGAVTLGGTNTTNMYFGVIGGNSKFYMGSHTGSMVPSSTISNNTWYWMAFTHTGGAVSNTNTNLYINGVDNNATVQGPWTPVMDGVGWIGRRNDAVFFNGEIAQVSIWDVALNQTNITAMYNSGTILDGLNNFGNYDQASNLIHHFAMDEGSGSSLDDDQQAANATLSGGYVWTTSGINVQPT